MSESEAYEVAWRQFGGALTMLRRAIEACPPSLWERASPRMGYWYLAYHALFFVDHDLHAADAGFESPWFDTFEYEMKDLAPPYENPYAREDLLTYLGQCLTKGREVLQSLGRGEPVHLRGSVRLDVPALEVVLYELRHVQHHAAQLNALLRSEGVEPPRWVRRLDGPPLDP